VPARERVLHCKPAADTGHRFDAKCIEPADPALQSSITQEHLIMIRHFIAVIAATLAFAAPLAQAAVDVNRASQAELETVKGIGPGLSTKILAARKSGEFKDWADMVDRVGGIGPGNAAKFSQAGLTVAGQAYAGAPTTPAPEKKARKAGDAKAADVPAAKR
jgi:competence protein ComEA